MNSRNPCMAQEAHVSPGCHICSVNVPPPECHICAANTPQCHIYTVNTPDCHICTVKVGRGPQMNSRKPCMAQEAHVSTGCHMHLTRVPCMHCQQSAPKVPYIYCQCIYCQYIYCQYRFRVSGFGVRTADEFEEAVHGPRGARLSRVHSR